MTITTPNQSSNLSPDKWSEQELDKLLDNPKSAKEDSEACPQEKFQQAKGYANDETEECRVDDDKYSKSHDYLSLMVNDMFLKLAYL